MCPANCVLCELTVIVSYPILHPSLDIRTVLEGKYHFAFIINQTVATSVG